jgi:hypothetical protein
MRSALLIRTQPPRPAVPQRSYDRPDLDRLWAAYLKDERLPDGYTHAVQHQQVLSAPEVFTLEG